MARVVMQAVVSVDGYIAYPDDTVGPLFDWYSNGDTEVSARASRWTFHVSQASAGYVQPFWDAIKVTVIGRRLSDTTNVRLVVRRSVPFRATPRRVLAAGDSI